MSYKMGGNPTRRRKSGNVYHFVTYYCDLVGFRNVPNSPSNPQEIIDELHNLRMRYDRLGFGLKRLDSKRRYYKRVRSDAPFASELPKKINSRIDSLRKIVRPGSLINFPSVNARVGSSASE